MTKAQMMIANTNDREIQEYLDTTFSPSLFSARSRGKNERLSDDEKRCMACRASCEKEACNKKYQQDLYVMVVEDRNKTLKQLLREDCVTEIFITNYRISMVSSLMNIYRVYGYELFSKVLMSNQRISKVLDQEAFLDENPDYRI